MSVSRKHRQPTDVRLYVDEDVAVAVAHALQESHDVTYVNETADRRKTDAWHLRRASGDERILVTVNHNDFKFLHRVWTSMRVFGVTDSQHYGILTVTRTPKSPEGWVEAINAELTDRQSIAGQLLVWHDKAGWREDEWRPDD